MMKKLFRILLLILYVNLGYSQVTNHKTKVKLSNTAEDSAIDTILTKKGNHEVQFATYQNFKDKLFADLPPIASTLPLDYSVNWVSGLTFNVIANRYYIIDTYYSATATSITLNTADATNDRIDLIIANTSGVISKITGTPSASPAEPNYDLATEFPLKFILVKAGQTAPSGVFNNLIYDENVLEVGGEWNTGGSGGGDPNYNATDQVYSYVKSISNSGGQTNRFTHPTGFPFEDLTSVSMWVKQATATTSPSLLITLHNGVSTYTQVLYDIVANGFDKNSTAWQNIIIPKSAFTDIGTTQIKLVWFQLYGQTSYHVDLVDFQLDTDAPSTPTTPSNETDPIYSVWDKSTGISITASQVSDFDTEVSNNASVTANTAKPTGTGTINTVAKFTSANSLGNSSITDDGINVAINRRTTIKDEYNADKSYPFGVKNDTQDAWYFRPLTTSNNLAIHLNGVGDLFTITTSGNIIPAGLVDGIDIATDVAANTAKVGVQADIIGYTELKPELKNTVELGNVSGVVNIDCSLGSQFNMTMTGAITSVTFTNVQQTKSITLIVTGNFAITQPTSVKPSTAWDGYDGTLTNQIQLYTYDGTTPYFSSTLLKL